MFSILWSQDIGHQVQDIYNGQPKLHMMAPLFYRFCQDSHVATVSIGDMLLSNSSTGYNLNHLQIPHFSLIWQLREHLYPKLLPGNSLGLSHMVVVYNRHSQFLVILPYTYHRYTKGDYYLGMVLDFQNLLLYSLALPLQQRPSTTPSPMLTVSFL